MSDKFYSVDGELFQYESIEDLMITEDLESFEVGYEVYEGEAYELGCEWVGAEHVIELIGDMWYDVGGECNDGFEVSYDARHELETFLQQWQEKYAQPPFKGIKNTRPYYLTQEDIDKVILADSEER